MQQKDPFKVEVWLDNSFYSKLSVATADYNVGILMQEIRTLMQQGTIPKADKIEIRQARI